MNKCSRCNELTDIIEQHKIWVKHYKKQLDQLKSENKHFNDLLNQVLKDYDKARETLTEIKEIAEREAESNRYNGASVWKKILQKISEVEDADKT